MPGLEDVVADWRLLEARHLDRRRHLFITRARLGSSRYEYLWPYATGWAAGVALGAVAAHSNSADAQAWVRGVHCYARRGERETSGPFGLESAVTPPLGRGGVRYYDDNAWVGLTALRQHALTGESWLVDLARRLFAFVVSGWSNNAGWVEPGGVVWHEAPNRGGRNTCSNAPAAALGAELASLGDAGALEWAARLYDWVKRALRRDDGLYADHLAPDGALESTAWSYNQGAMIGAGVRLAAATGDACYLAEANTLAELALRRFSRPEVMAREPAVFIAVLVRNLFLLDEALGELRSRCFAQSWAELRAAAPPRGDGVLLSRAPLIEVQALLAGAPPHP